MEDRDRMEVFELGKLIGQAEMSNATEKICKITRLKILKRIQDEGLHKCMPGCKNMHEVFKLVKVSKTTGYEELKTLELMGDQAVELLIELGIASKDSYLLAKSLEAGEDAEFAVLDKESGEFRVAGQVVTMDADRGLISSSLLKMIQRLKLEQGARLETERKLEEKADEAKTLREKVHNGEEQVRQLQKQAARALTGEQLVTPIGQLLPEFILVVGRILNEEVLEEDKQYIDNYLNIFEGQYGKLLEKFRHFLPEGM